MIKALFEKTNVVTVRSDDFDEEACHGKAVLTVNNEGVWVRMLPAILTAGNRDPDIFGLEVHKVFHLEESDTVCTWVVIYWGELDVPIEDALLAALTKKVAAPPPSAMGRATHSTAPRTAPAARQPAVAEDTDDDSTVKLRSDTKEDAHYHTIQNRERRRIGDSEYTVTTVRLAHVNKARFMNSDATLVFSPMANYNGPPRVAVFNSSGDFSPSVSGNKESL